MDSEEANMTLFRIVFYLHNNCPVFTILKAKYGLINATVLKWNCSCASAHKPMLSLLDK